MMSQEIDIRDRVAGSLYGLLVGDAMGCPVEGWSSQKIAKRYGWLASLQGCGRRPRGLHSDDGQQALAVCDALLEAPHTPAAVFARILVELYRDGPEDARFGLHRGTGVNFRTTVKGLCEDKEHPHAHSVVTAGNGAAMRIAPAALFFRDDPNALRRTVVDVSAVTHGDLRGVAAAHALATLVARAAAWQEGSAPLLDAAWVDEVRCCEAEARRRFARLGTDHAASRLARELYADIGKSLDLGALLQRIAVRAAPLASRPVSSTSGFALCSVFAAIAVFARTSNFREAVETAVNLGGDTDTMGAMVGGVAGALYGWQQIPKEWLQSLVANGDLEERIEMLVERRTAPPTPPLVSLEQQWSWQSRKKSKDLHLDFEH